MCAKLVQKVKIYTILYQPCCNCPVLTVLTLEKPLYTLFINEHLPYGNPLALFNNSAGLCKYLPQLVQLYL